MKGRIMAQATTIQDLKDGELLRAFRQMNDQGAFAELMGRHGSMVVGAARSVVGDDGRAQDVAQATFLALWRKSPELEEDASVAGWLHHVALCLARNERRGEVRRWKREQDAADLAVEPESTTSLSDAALAALHEELGALPDRYRRPLILHYMERQSYVAAAPLCDCETSTFSTRLTPAREKLRKRLIKRGITGVTMSSLVAMLAQTGEAADVSAGFVAATCAAAKGGAVTAKVTALKQSVNRVQTSYLCSAMTGL